MRSLLLWLFGFTALREPAHELFERYPRSWLILTLEITEDIRSVFEEFLEIDPFKRFLQKRTMRKPVILGVSPDQISDWSVELRHNGGRFFHKQNYIKRRPK